ncbi:MULTISPECIES: serine hydrolase [Kocuria]|uniref:serine hydrolase n=1 Tax=Kocuria TaxID=57493 RepID=UPI0007EB80BB|nr:serine hydrolase [Kocuria sp. ICS0012]MBX7555452.1 class A beta-lactamase-related serine hydrolase [Streptomyces sp. tea 10]OBA51398.1 hypothetical protein A5728_00055 [Kocuria sp. ICS0012]
MSGETWNSAGVDAALRQLGREVAEFLQSEDMTGAVSARVIDAPELPVFSFHEEEVFPAASLYKLAVMMAFCREVDHGVLEPSALVDLSPADRAQGPTGLAILEDTVRISWRDLVRLMMSISDNAAAEAVLRKVRTSRVHETLRLMGAMRTEIRPTPPSGNGAPASFDDEGRDRYLMPDPVEYDPLSVSSTTASDLVTLLCAIWQDRAASAEQCAFMRQVLSQQAWGHRFAEAFSYPGVTVAAKTGSFGSLSHEAGVVSHPGEKSIAVAVLTRSVRRERQIPLSNKVVGQIARHCVRNYRQFL